jgi:hypothetical protein
MRDHGRDTPMAYRYPDSATSVREGLRDASADKQLTAKT